jgi:hypothetical protein
MKPKQTDTIENNNEKKCRLVVLSSVHEKIVLRLWWQGINHIDTYVQQCTVGYANARSTVPRTTSIRLERLLLTYWLIVRT